MVFWSQVIALRLDVSLVNGGPLPPLSFCSPPLNFSILHLSLPPSFHSGPHRSLRLGLQPDLPSFILPEISLDLTPNLQGLSPTFKIIQLSYTWYKIFRTRLRTAFYEQDFSIPICIFSFLSFVFLSTCPAWSGALFLPGSRALRDSLAWSAVLCRFI